jgi:6-phosphofructokinase 1
MSQIKNIAVFTSGGDSPGMNAAIRAVVRSTIFLGMKAYGIERGYEGMIDGDIIAMDTRSVSNILQLGGTILQTSRSPRFMTPEGRALAYANLQKHGINGIVAIGGNGTYTGAGVFMQEFPDIKMVGLPGTIDNDLYGTDFTIGYDTAINTAMDAVDKIKDTANAHNRIFFVEVMGRDAGFIALRTAIACGAEAVLVPETETNLDELVASLQTNIAKKKRSSIVIVSEGDEAGGAYEVSKYVQSKLPDADIRVTVLGHIQRGGRPSCNDRILASRLGLEAVKALVNGESGIAIGQNHHDVKKTSFANAIKHHQKLNKTLLEMVEWLS